VSSSIVGALQGRIEVLISLAADRDYARSKKSFWHCDLDDGIFSKGIIWHYLDLVVTVNSKRWIGG
jgi:hypothetical protein